MPAGEEGDEDGLGGSSDTFFWVALAVVLASAAFIYGCYCC